MEDCKKLKQKGDNLFCMYCRQLWVYHVQTSNLGKDFYEVDIPDSYIEFELKLFKRGEKYENKQST